VSSNSQCWIYLLSCRWSGERKRRVEWRGGDTEDRKDRSPDKWKHDLFEENDQASQSAVGDEGDEQKETG